ncbi:nucleic acid-binding protein [Xylaria cf. heliscus]|nr:nucleic acid-binding protein [Xylaria cf. heliscus]
MVKNIGKGGKTRRRGKRDENMNSRELLIKEVEQDYAVIEKALGSGRFSARSFDGTTKGGVVRLAIRRGALRKLTLQPGDIVLLGLREWQDSKADILHQYTTEEAWRLHSLGELPLSALRYGKDKDAGVAGDSNGKGDDDVIFGFDEDDDDADGPQVDIDAI